MLEIADAVVVDPCAAEPNVFRVGMFDVVRLGEIKQEVRPNLRHADCHVDGFDCRPKPARALCRKITEPTLRFVVDIGAKHRQRFDRELVVRLRIRGEDPFSHLSPQRV